MKVRNLKPLSLFAFFFSIKTHRIENKCYATGKYTVCRRVRAAFSKEILQAGAVKGLNLCQKIDVICEASGGAEIAQWLERRDLVMKGCGFDFLYELL